MEAIAMLGSTELLLQTPARMAHRFHDRQFSIILLPPSILVTDL